VRRFALSVGAMVAILAPAAPAFAHGGDAPLATAYRVTVGGITTPEKGLSVRAVEAGGRLELRNETGHPVEVLGYSGEPYLAIRPDGTWENVNSPAAYLNQTLNGDSPVPATADPTEPPAWRRLATTTTVRWHDRRTHWLSPGRPPQAAADPGRMHRLRDWVVPLRVQTRTFEIRGTLDWVPPPHAGLWWVGAALTGLITTGLALRRPRWITPLALLAGSAPLLYGLGRALDGGTTTLVPLIAGLLALAAAYRHPPFYSALAGTALAIFAGLAEVGSFGAAVLPVAGPAWAARAAVAVALGAGAGLALAGVLRLRAALPVAAPPG
jgi:hypothetical protein